MASETKKISVSYEDIVAAEAELPSREYDDGEIAKFIWASLEKRDRMLREPQIDGVYKHVNDPTSECKVLAMVTMQRSGGKGVMFKLLDRRTGEGEVPELFVDPQDDFLKAWNFSRVQSLAL